MPQYYECHVTMLGVPAVLRPLVEHERWKFSAIDGDPSLGPGLKCYATRHYNARIGEAAAVCKVLDVADLLAASGAEVLRRKVELVVFDDRSATVREACDGACVECVG